MAASQVARIIGMSYQIPRAAAILYVCIVKESDTSRATAPCCSMYQLQQVNKVDMKSKVTEGKGLDLTGFKTMDKI
jgi:hypothetical protein